MGKYYVIDHDLALKAKSYLINNKKALNELYPEEESELLMNLNDDLREGTDALKGRDLQRE
jgi:hypothetical protein